VEEAFACPECGSIVEVSGLALGRQVRCGFCHRLLEVPYLPRIEEKSWKRRRFGRPWWVPWAWGALGLAAAAVILMAMTRFVDHHERQAFERSIKDLTVSSEDKTKSGRLDQALVDLDTALNLCQQSSRCASELLAELRKKRQEVAIREAHTVLDRLSTDDVRPFPIGDWLTLKSRAASDPDLASLRGQVEEQFQGKLKQRIERDLNAAKSALASGQAGAAFESCEATAPLLARLTAAEQKSLRSQADQLVAQLVDRHGIFLVPPRGHFLRGSESKYQASMMPVLFKAVKAKGYVAQVSSPLWRDHWSRAPYRLALEVNERLEGNYMASENRLTRIEASLTLYRRGQQIWKTTPAARTMVPLPSLPAYLSTRVALSPARMDEFESMLYDNARSLIDEKFAFALSNMPGCEYGPASSKP
jgi:hypothetical protein